MYPPVRGPGEGAVYQGPPAPGQWNPYGPSWGGVPPGPPRPSGRKWVVGGIVAGVVIVAAGVVAAVGLSSDKSSTTSAPATTSAATTSSSAATRVLPSQVLPSEQQMKQTTLQDLAKHGDVDTAEYPDAKTDPPTCSLVNRPAGISVIGPAISVAGLSYRDKPGDDYGATAFAYVAVFDTADAADAAQQKLAHAAQTCTTFTDLERDKSDPPARPWIVADVKATDHQVAWNNSEQTDDGTPWVCAKAARAQDNLLVLTMLCDPNPADAPTKLIDVIISNINAKK
jgi:PknH-like extracellular domain